jgi:flagellar biosynthetic protein FliP
MAQSQTAQKRWGILVKSMWWKVPLISLPLLAASGGMAMAAGLPSISISPSGSSPSDTISILALLTLISFIPAILLTMTAFTRIITVLSFVRSALGLQDTPPNQVLIGLGLFITLFVMSPTLTQINHHALTPYLAGRLSLTKAAGAALAPMRTFMYQQTAPDDIALFLNLAHLPHPHNLAQIPTTSLIPAFIISELRTAFEIGVYIYIPFVLIDLVVSTILMSMGMMMLPPTLISLPLKLLLFVLANGWTLVVQSLVLSFHGGG